MCYEMWEGTIYIYHEAEIRLVYQHSGEQFLKLNVIQYDHTTSPFLRL